MKPTVRSPRHSMPAPKAPLLVQDFISAAIVLAVVWGAFSLLFEMPDNVVTTGQGETMLAKDAMPTETQMPLPVVMTLQN